MARALNPYRGGDYRGHLPLTVRLLAKRRCVPAKNPVDVSTASSAPEAHQCWEWTGQLDKRGYGRMSHQGRKQFIHALAYKEFIGPIPEGLEPDHLCKNPACFNPWHLELVSHPENTRRGRVAKLTHTDIAIIRALDEPHTVTAELFGVHPSTICDIRNNRRWNYSGRSS
jgi:HNH endonuclease